MQDGTIADCHSTSRAPGRVLLATLLAVLLLGCGDRPTAEQRSAEQRGEAVAAIQAHVAGAERQAQVMAIYDAWQTLIRERRQEHEAERRRLAALNADYNARRQDFEELYQLRDVGDQRFIGRVFAVREQLRGALTAEEWQQLDALRSQAQWQLPILEEEPHP
jgi:hypothetical protein